ncbi:helix-turn-helix domain-containing protein [Aggregatibacter actinomycetemcomitans]|nr:helix-turn-helix domain-containing protein [Aggregatibacter actinomycetemcomitans]
MKFTLKNRCTWFDNSRDKKTMKKFDELCLTPVPTFTPDEIKAIREKEHVSQTVFAHYLNVSKNMISEWERGVKNQPERR